MIPFHKRGRFALAVIAVSAATAAHGAEPPSPNATDPNLGTAPPTYRSAFEDYRKFRPGPVSSWKGANDTVGAVGGHVGALKTTPAPATGSPAADAPEAPAPKAVPVKPVTGGAGHLGHH